MRLAGESVSLRVERFVQAFRRKLHEQLFGFVARQHLGAGVAIRGVALSVVPMKVGIHKIPHRFGRDLFFDLGDQSRGGGRLGMRIHNQHVGGAHKNAGVTIANRGRTGARKGHALGNLFKCRRAGGWPEALSPVPTQRGGAPVPEWKRPKERSPSPLGKNRGGMASALRADDGEGDDAVGAACYPFCWLDLSFTPNPISGQEGRKRIKHFQLPDSAAPP